MLVPAPASQSATATNFPTHGAEQDEFKYNKPETFKSSNITLVNTRMPLDGSPTKAKNVDLFLAEN